LSFCEEERTVLFDDDTVPRCAPTPNNDVLVCVEGTVKDSVKRMLQLMDALRRKKSDVDVETFIVFLLSFLFFLASSYQKCTYWNRLDL